MPPQRKNSVMSWLLLDLALSFMLCVFAPLEAFFSNESEYWFHLSHLLPVVVVVFAVVFASLAILSVAVGRTRLSTGAYALLLFLLLFLYVQGNYVPRPYGVLNGVEIDWDAAEYRSVGNVSVALLVVSAVAWLLSVSLPRVRRGLASVGNCVCVILCGLQIVTLATLYLQNNVMDDNSSPNIAMTSDKWLDFSSTNNVLIVLLDTFDGKDMNDILAGPEGDFVRRTLEDFTYYPDTLGLYPTTKGAVPHILTGRVYTNEMPFSDYLSKAYREAPIFREMARRGYSACAYSDLRLMPRDIGVFENVYPDKCRISDKFSFVRTLYSVVAFNYLPHQLKRHFVVPDDAFMAFRESLSNSTPYVENMQSIFAGLKSGDVKRIGNAGAFRFYHARGVHPPFNFGKDLVPRADVKSSYQDAALGCVTLLETFLGKLKAGDVYDASTIIVMADHGHVRYSQNPLFMVKNKGERHAFRVSGAQMSYLFFPELLLGLVRDGADISEESIAARSKRQGGLTYLLYRWDDSWNRRYLPLIQEMRLKGNAALTDGATFESTGRQFGGKVTGGDFEPYAVGTTLDFGRAGRKTTREYLASGFGMASDVKTWTCEKEATMRFRLDKKVDDLQLEFDCGTFNGVQPVTLSANGAVICQTDFSKRGRHSFPIPATCIGKRGELTLHFDLPGAVSPDELTHNGNMRQLALCFYTLRIYSEGDEEMPEKTFSFAGDDGAPGRKLCPVGVGRPEREYTWTIGDRLEIRLQARPRRSRPVTVTLKYGTYLPKERVVAAANGRELEHFVAKGEEEKAFLIPASCLDKDGTVTLSLTLPDAISPKDLGRGGDDRRLALRLYSLTVK